MISNEEIEIENIKNRVLIHLLNDVNFPKLEKIKIALTLYKKNFYFDPRSNLYHYLLKKNQVQECENCLKITSNYSEKAIKAINELNVNFS